MTTPFSIPPPFMALESAGRFDYWGAPYNALTETQRRDRMRTHLTQVLWWRSIEWDRSSAEILSFVGDDALRPGLVPFAGNGYGDQYCWYPAWQTGAEPPVVLVLHDEMRSRLFATHFGECLCRCFLQSFADDDPDDDFDFTPEALWDAHFDILRPVLTSEQVDLLHTVRADFAPTGCAEADDRIAASIPDRSLVAIQPPTRYSHEHLDRATLLRPYDESISFFRELVEVEGRPEFTRKLEEATTARRSL